MQDIVACRAVDLSQLRVSWMGATIQRGPEHRSRGIAIVGAVTRQLLVKTLQAGRDLACGVVNCKVWRLAMASPLVWATVYCIQSGPEFS
jgi:hypothetical protein